jgi:hypothetical protein
MISRRAAIVATLLATSMPASAQQGSTAVDPIVANFREYRAALERNDLPAAETAAAAALAASEAAQGRRTAVLALNLANLRLELGSGYDALTPARTAHALATASTDSGVDPAAAALTLGRAQIAAGEPAGAARLLEAFAAAETSPALETDVYNAAVALGVFAIDVKDYASARRAWSTAGRRSGATENPPFSRALALTGEGAAIFLAGSDRAVAGRSEEPSVLSAGDAKAASDAFATAQRLLLPVAFTTVDGATLTAGQRAYAQAMAWHSALQAKVEAGGSGVPAPPSFGADLPPFDNDALCRIRTIRDDAEIVYPPEALDRYGVGAVVVHLGLDQNGAVVSRTTAAAIPPGVLAEAVDEVAGKWRVEKDPSSPAGCRMPPAAYVNVRFVLE